ncbi:hypothetical protein [Schaalia cardiffensis]|uniref:Uncharacterized protein n=1 Tax=Schaalia cardiffensis F0333 TaxID=888050 RepID=N6XAF7_9ACTO|nr:hypothetical protein [Schaalia cardiffensis]ENO18128.1 hypothetical protein HMPREF9004_1159 [Schaalia cardiffensis F0333]
MTHWFLLLVPVIVVVGAVFAIAASLMIRRQQARAYRQRAYFQDHYGYSFFAFLAHHQVDRRGLDELLRREGSGAEKRAIRYVQNYEDVPDHVARRLVRSRFEEIR